MRIVFMGNHTVGTIVLRELMGTEEVLAVFAHPHHPDDGVAYESVTQLATENNIPVYQPAGMDGACVSIIAKHKPDLIVNFAHHLRSLLENCQTQRRVF